jgi:REP element-mobilizing transposase RayT
VAQTAGFALQLAGEFAMNQFTYKEIYGRNLPHLQPPEATLFVTFRLDGSIPKSVLEQWRQEKKQLEMTLLRWAAIAPTGTVPDPEAMAAEKLTFHRRWFKKFEDLLDGAKTGPLWLQEERVARIVAEALRQRDGAVYQLDAFSVMPNHVHAVFAPYLTEALAQELAERAIQRKKAGPPEEKEEKVQYVLASIMQSLKGWTARACNLELGRRGQFWQHESFDHVVRDEAEWERTVQYVINNPVKAGLVERWQDWPWSYRCLSAEETASEE